MSAEHAEHGHGHEEEETVSGEIWGGIKKIANSVRVAINSVLKAGKNLWTGLFGKKEHHAAPAATHAPVTEHPPALALAPAH